MGDRSKKGEIEHSCEMVTCPRSSLERGIISWEMKCWLHENEGSWDFFLGNVFGHVLFSFENPNTAFAFKMRWC